ncbi:hypothetical protein, conserved [Leishmania tarentolae]|uniref:Uncharacterized protein n=1 Tax=Leishmania tarentolae TaxID=5689 RepID=A0A640KAV7_LEITA|nr:hypothetical protein, conserved [Leishmania tarentolae]
MDSGRHQVSPLVVPSSAHSRNFSKTTVTSANVVSISDANLSLTSTCPSTNDRHPLRGAHTPHRRTSMVEKQQPTPRGSLQWPSTHRSFSSATVTRDSSRHSQMADRMNATGVNVSVVRQHGHAGSSASHTPMSSHDERSEHQLSVFSGVGCRRGYSLGHHPTAPPLVDFGDSPSFSRHSAAHSMCTTALCTPRDGTATSSHAPLASPSITMNYNSASISGPPPLCDFEAEAHLLTREQLEERVLQMRAANVVLQTSVLRLRESLATLQEGMRANYADLERRQECIANMLLRRLEATKRRRSKLVAHLRTVEAEKALQEAKLRNITQSIKDLSKHLKQEEKEIANRLQRRLDKLHAQRKQLDHALEEQTNTLQQLEQLVQEVEEMDRSDAADTSAGYLATQSAALTPVHPSALSSSATAPSSSIILPVHERSSSRMSAASSTTATTMADVAYDPTAMIRYLEQEITAAESLRTEALSKAESYVATRERLERRLAREKQKRAEQYSRTQALRQQLQDASTAVNEKETEQTLAMEMEADRHLNSCRFGGDLISSASSTCATPQLRVMSAVASRGNSMSPSFSRPCPGTAAQELEARQQDSFMLPVSSACGAQATSASHHAHLRDISGVSVSMSGCTSLGDAPAAAPALDTLNRLSSSSTPLNAQPSEEATVYSEGGQHGRLLQQETWRVAAPRPVTSAENTLSSASPPKCDAQGPML